MARTNYSRGYETERKIISTLEEEGYLTLRSAGSHSKIDVLGIRKDGILAIQSKRTKKFTMSSYKKEIAAIQELIRKYELVYNVSRIQFELWVWIDRRGFRKWVVTSNNVKEVA